MNVEAKQSPLRWAFQQLRSRDPLDVVPRITLLLVVPEAHPALEIPSVLVILAVLFLPRVYRSPWFWLLIAALLGVDNYDRWVGLDNHLVLINYWAAALGFSFLSDHPERTLATSARLLIGLAFLLATGWKIASGQFLNGDTFHYLFLTDDRFEPVARYVGGLSTEDLRHNATAAASLSQATDGITLRSAGSLRAAATGLAWLTVAVEAAVALAFLSPRRTFAFRNRNLALWAFAAGTYLLVPVTRFGAVLLTMGYAQAERNQRTERAYLFGFVLLILYSPLWHAVVDPTFR